MRVLMDTNVFVSYLLSSSRRPTGVVATIVEAAFDGAFDLLVSEESLEELLLTLTTKRYLAERIGVDQARGFIADIRAVGTTLPPITDPLPRIVRDPKDDYLLAYALVGQADYLVTGDDDLLALSAVDRLRIISPAAFAQELTRR